MIVDALRELKEMQEQNNPTESVLTKKLMKCLIYEQDNKWELCDVCHKIKHHEEWKRLGFNTAKEYIDYLRAEGYHIDQKTFSEYVRVKELLSRFEITRDFFLEVGFYKFRELIRLMDKINDDEMRDFISKLPYMSIRELRNKKDEILGLKKKTYKNNEKENSNKWDNQYESISDEDIEKMTGDEDTEKMKGEDATCEDTSWGVEYEPDMVMYSFDIYGEEEKKIVDKALDIAEKLCPRKFKSAYFVYICKKFVELNEGGLLN